MSADRLIAQEVSHSIHRFCAAVGLARSSHHAWKAERSHQQGQKDACIRARVRATFRRLCLAARVRERGGVGISPSSGCRGCPGSGRRDRNRKNARAHWEEPPATGDALLSHPQPRSRARPATRAQPQAETSGSGGPPQRVEAAVKSVRAERGPSKRKAAWGHCAGLSSWSDEAVS